MPESVVLRIGLCCVVLSLCPCVIGLLKDIVKGVGTRNLVGCQAVIQLQGCSLIEPMVMGFQSPSSTFHHVLDVVEVDLEGLEDRPSDEQWR